ncbi:MAG TPA: autotransporter domain-containing protein [Devosiaceae bacterium]|nr:autotransporter domain-containing protein [Devosiaceae bacterium]
MSRFRTLRLLANYNILTPVALIGTGVVLSLSNPALAAEITNPADGTITTTVTIADGDSYINDGTIDNPNGTAVTSSTDIGSLTNASGAIIGTEADDFAVLIQGNADTITNDGDIGITYHNPDPSYSSDGIEVTGDVTTFTNSGSIATGNYAVYIEGATGSFDNNSGGTITSDDGTAVFLGIYAGGGATSFNNSGSIESDSDTAGDGVVIYGTTGSFTNTSTGTITSNDGNAVWLGKGTADATVNDFNNAGSIMATNNAAINIEGSDSVAAAGTVTNSGTVTGVGAGFFSSGDVGDFTNSAGGTITATNDDTDPSDYSGAYEANGVFAIGNVTGTFTNDGTITATGQDSSVGYGATDYGYLSAGVGITGDVNKFVNTGDIEAQAGGSSYGGESTSLGGVGVAIGGETTDFENSGTIHGSGSGVYFGNYQGTGWYAGKAYFDEPSESHVGTFTNDATGAITGDQGVGVVFTDGVDSFDNAGQITGHGTPVGEIPSAGVFIAGGVTSFTNSGSITADQDGVQIFSGVGTFTNTASGTITSADGFGAYVSDFALPGPFSSPSNTPVAFNNFTNNGTISGALAGVEFATSSPVNIVNTGNILGTGAGSVGLIFNGGTLNNSGTIQGAIGILDTNLAGSSIVNTGSIIGTDGPGLSFVEEEDPTVTTSGLIQGSTVSIQFAGSAPDTLVVNTGAKIVGTVSFGSGVNTIDVSGYTGNLVIDFNNPSGSPVTVVNGSNLYVATTSQLTIVDATSIRQSAQPVEDLVGGIQDSMYDALSGEMPSTDDQSFVSKAPGKGTTVWGDVFSGGSTNGGPGSSIGFGGFVAGAQAEYAPGLTLGLLASYGHTNFSLNNPQQTISSNVGTVGIYGSKSLNAITLDFSLLGGFGGNTSRRQIGGTTTETATADYNSWFLAPEVGASVPLAHFQKGQLNLAGRLGYIGGSFAGYTESGSSSDLTVGAQDISVLTASAELNGKTAIAHTSGTDINLTGKVGVFTDDNVGNSAVSVSMAGFGNMGAGSVTTDSTGTGAYAGLGLEAPIATGFTVGASLTGSARSDGNYGGVGRFRISGSF